jgi:hypothetical protein
VLPLLLEHDLNCPLPLLGGVRTMERWTERRHSSAVDGVAMTMASSLKIRMLPVPDMARFTDAHYARLAEVLESWR